MSALGAKHLNRKKMPKKHQLSYPIMTAKTDFFKKRNYEKQKKA
jgi:hypothetical protein